MHYLKRNTKYSILAFLVLILSITISISTLAKTEVYFSLSDNPQKAIIKNINQAEVFINIAMYIFTDREIALPLAKAHERGVKVRLYLDKEQVDYQYSQSRFLVQKGIKVRISTNNYIMHNKFAIIDNHILLTGSYNWTFSANNRNDENLMVIDDPELIEIFQNQFVNLWTNKYSLERTQKLYKIAKVDFLPVSPTSVKTKDKIININSASLKELTSILRISESLAQKIITFREDLGGFKDPQDLTQLPEITNLEWEEWKEQGIVINIE
ncbi:helix-hairpin-helix domain-containing protein [bacterium]|nr:helix-hairpin-helix domain-containing protein [bacterium]